MMRVAALSLLLLASAVAFAQDVRPGIASIAIVTAEPEGRYGMDGTVVKPAKLKRTLKALDEQLAIGYLHLKPGQAAISPEQLAEIRTVAADIGAQLMVEKDGQMQPDVAAPTVPGG